MPSPTSRATIRWLRPRAQDGKRGENEVSGRIVGERQIAATSDLIIAVSEFEKNLIVSRYNADPANIAVASPGVDHVTFAPISEKETKPGHAGHRNSGASSARADGVQERVKGAEPSGANIPAKVSEPTIVFTVAFTRSRERTWLCELCRS